ncbi:DsbA family oxidoreductase [Sediminitomix flava]|uniref:Putative DsbA family dithiol-disulfide isomerase n=1 Tax=Sediminitomix flava TaxID=379075 RepID=A0A315Z7X8_SEDFL|nr:DsbA family oxidoreductase [Sediminitomix flava]PWJ39146.1 putative DsbA family dithiol-disulfide isomerase [Sediminitomix flava]
MTKKLKIDIVSDVVCPWCYVGNSRLEKALAENKDIMAEITWHPFQLHPDVAKGQNLNAAEFLGNKYQRDPQPMIDQMQQVADQEGVEMNFDKVLNIPNTLDAHRLMHYAREEKKDTELSLTLFKAYFVEGKDMENKDILVECGKQAGLSEEAISKFDSSEEALQSVIAEETQFRNAGVSAVPTFIINDKFMIQGAQPAEVWKQAFEQIEGLPLDDANACGPDGCEI